jgi:hypothetical protein
MEKDILFRKVIALTGLTGLIAPGMIRRALKDVGADPVSAGAGDYLRALHKVEVRLRAYYSDDEARQRVEGIRALLESPEAG